MIEKRHLKKVYSNLEHYFCPLYSESYKVSWKQPPWELSPTNSPPNPPSPIDKLPLLPPKAAASPPPPKKKKNPKN